MKKLPGVDCIQLELLKERGGNQEDFSRHKPAHLENKNLARTLQKIIDNTVPKNGNLHLCQSAISMQRHKKRISCSDTTIEK